MKDIRDSDIVKKLVILWQNLWVKLFVKKLETVPLSHQKN